MLEITPKIYIDSQEVDYFEGQFQRNGQLTPSTITFKLPLTEGLNKKLWNKEVTLFISSDDTLPLFRGWIKRVKENFDSVEVYAEDAIGYMVKGGEQSVAKVALTDEVNIDGLTIGAAIRKLFVLAKLDSKIKTDYIGDTTPIVNSVSKPIRGTINPLDIIKQLLSKAVDNSATIPKPNIARLIDDGQYSQFIIELESDLDTGTIAHTFTEHDNITDLNIINRKVPTVIVVNGANNSKGTFTHDSAIDAYDRNYLEVTNQNLLSPAACKDFAQKLFRANLKVQFEYSFNTFEGLYLEENDVIKIITDEEEFAGNYRVIGKSITFSPSTFSIGLNINRKPPTLAEYIASLDN
tara:strand:+ start:6211 stop:7263 length:1053 start_codon:yes stop_codon:yes gene_type:complete